MTMQGIYQGIDMVAGDVPLTVALDLAQDGTGTSSLALAHTMIMMGGYAEVMKL